MSLPEQIGRYRIAGRLATGGMAEVLIGKLIGPAGFQRPVVVKRVLPHLARQEEFRGMFLDEARIVSGLRHANVVQVHELGQDGEELFLVMEYLAGESLAGLGRRMKKAGKRLDPALAAYAIAEACAGLHAAHELKDEEGNPRHIVHRDVSPQNIIVTYDGSVKILDFGIAKAADRYTHTATGHMKGKFPYMAPEQIAGIPLDRRADIFALGTVLWEATAGKRLFKRPSEFEIMRAIREDVVPPLADVVPDCPPVLNAICMRALAREKEDRYQTAAQMRRELVAEMRTLDPHRIPQERMAELMNELFDDHIARKKDMLRRVTADTELTGIPSFDDSDTIIETPASIPESATGGTLSARDHSIHPPARFPIAAKLGLVAGAFLAAVVTILILVDSDDPEPHAANAPPSEAEETTAAEVAVHISTTPSGAAITIDGEERGATPTSIALPQGDDDLTLELWLDGYLTQTLTVTPDVDQRLQLSLEREAEPTAPEATPVSMSMRSMMRPRMRPQMGGSMDDGFFQFE